MEQYIIIGVRVSDRLKHAGAVQKVLTDYGCNIKTRLGLHEASQGVCATNGVLLLQIYGGEKVADEMLAKLSAIEGINAKKMVI